jgi:hypothetical protein
MNFDIDPSSVLHWSISIGGIACSVLALLNDKKSGRRPITFASFGGRLKGKDPDEAIWFSDASKDFFKSGNGHTLNESEVFSRNLSLTNLKKMTPSIF